MTDNIQQPKFTYDNTLTPIEMVFIAGYMRKQDIDGLVDYLEDCVLWKRQHYIEVPDEFQVVPARVFDEQGD